MAVGPALPWLVGAPDPLSALDAMSAPLAGLELMARVRRGMWVHSTTPRPPVGLTPHAVVHRQNKLVLRHYPASGERRVKTPLVVVPSLINRAYICDLEPDRSIVAGLSRLGHPVYLVDWGVPGPEDAGQDVGAVLAMLRRSIDRACRHAGAPTANVFGYCQGGTLAAMAAALYPERVGALMVLNAPVKFSEGGRFRTFVEPGHLDVGDLIGADGLVSPELMSFAFKLLDPMGNWSKFGPIGDAREDPVALRRTLARERWLEDNVPMAGAFAREFIGNAYQQDRLMDGTWEIRGRRVLLRDITAPIGVVVCKRDAISPAEACRPLVTAVGSADRELIELDAGHIGVVVGGIGPKMFYPLLDRWFRAHGPDRPREGAA